MEDPTAGNPGAGQVTGSVPQSADMAVLEEKASLLRQFTDHFKKKAPETAPSQPVPDNPVQFAENLGVAPPMASSLEQPIVSSPLEAPAVTSDVAAPSIQPDLTQVSQIPTDQSQQEAPSSQVSEPSILNNSSGINQGVVGEQPKKEEPDLSELRESLNSIDSKASELSQAVKGALRQLDEKLGTDLSGEQQPVAPTSSPNPEPVEATP